jgi:hypothetical protein
MDQSEAGEEIEYWKEKLERLRRLHQPEMLTKVR